MVFLAEAVLLCLLFTAVVVPSVIKDPLAWVSDYPPAIEQRAKELGLIPAQKKRFSASVLARKAAAGLLMVLVLTVALIHLNGAESFWQGFVLSYGLFAVVVWYDALVLDCLWFCHSKKAVIPGTEDMTESYHDYWFHIKMSLIGMLLGLPVSLATGLAVWAFA